MTRLIRTLAELAAFAAVLPSAPAHAGHALGNGGDHVRAMFLKMGGAVMKHLEELVRNGDVGDDEERAAETRVQKLTDDHTSKIDELLKRKEAEIMEV